MAVPEDQSADVHQIDDVRLWLEQGSSIHIKAVTSTLDPAELSSTQARRLAALLVELADKADE